MALFNFEALRQNRETQKSYDYLREHREFLDAEEIQINETDEFDVSRSFDYSANLSLQQAEGQLLDEVVRSLTDDIFNHIFSNW